MILAQWQRAALVGAPSPWTPAALASLEMDLDMGAAVLDTGRVASVPDLHGLHHAVQLTAGDRPAPDPAKIINGHVPIRFYKVAGETEHLDLATPIAGLTSAHLFLVYQQARQPVGDLDSGLYCFGSSGVNSLVPYNTGAIYDDFGSTARQTCGAAVLQTWTAPRCYEVITKANSWTNRIDGVEQYTTATNTVAWAAAQSIGKSFQAIVYFNGWKWRLTVFSAELTGADLALMRAYITAQYGVTFA